MFEIAKRADCPYSYQSLYRLAQRAAQVGLEDVVCQPVRGGRIFFDEKRWQRWIRSRQVRRSVERPDDVASIG